MSRQTWALLAKRNRARRDLTEKVEVWRSSSSSDGQGGLTAGAPARVATLPGKVEPVTERAATVADRIGVVAAAVIVFPFDAIPATGDEYRVGGERYAFVGSDVGTTNAATVRVVVSAVT